MSTWFSAAAARFAMRQSLGWSQITPAILVLASIFAVAIPLHRQLAVASVFALVYAVPFAATRLIEADRDGRQDHLRLTGHPEGRLLASLALGWAGPWLFIGVVAVIVWISAGSIDRTGALFVAALVGASFTLSLLALSLPRGEVGPDARLVAIGLVGIALLGSIVQLIALEGLSASGSGTTATVRAIAIGLLVVEAVVSAVSLPFVLRTIVRPALSARGRGPLLRVFPPGWNPALSRSFNLCALPAAYMAAIAAMLLAVLWRAFPAEPADADWLFIHFVVYAPLGLCLFIISTGARADRDSGRFDLQRLAPARPLTTLASLGAGACLPFVIATAGLHALVWLLWGQAARGFVTALLTLAFAAPVAGVEGWLRRWPLVYTVPLIFVVLRGLLTEEASVWSLALLLWIPWVCTVRVFRRPDRPPLSGWLGVATTLALAVPSVAPVVMPLFSVDTRALCIFLILLPGVIVDRTWSRALDRWGPGVAGAMLAAAVVLKSNQPAVAALIVALAPFSAWWLAMRVHLSTTGGWSTGIRALLLVAMILMAPYEISVYGYFAPYVSVRDPARAQWLMRTYAISAALFLIPAILAEGVYHFRRRRAPAANRSTRP